MMPTAATAFGQLEVVLKIEKGARKSVTLPKNRSDYKSLETRLQGMCMVTAMENDG